MRRPSKKRNDNEVKERRSKEEMSKETGGTGQDKKLRARKVGSKRERESRMTQEE